MPKSLLDYLREAPAIGMKLISSVGELSNVGDLIDQNNALVAMDERHANGHRGIVFNLSAKLDIPANSSIYLVGVTGGSTIHFGGYHFDANEGGIEIRLLEDVTYSGGTPQASVNRNRTSDRVTTLTVLAGATVTDDGTTLHLIGVPDAVTQQARSAETGGDPFEWLLASGERAYAIKLTNLDASDARVVYADFQWYEPGLLG